MKELISPVVRAVLQVVSGYLISKGLLSHAESGPVTEAVAGAVIAVFSVVWSSVEKKRLKAGQEPPVPPVTGLLLLLIPLLAFAPVGCAIKQPPERIAINAASSVILTADSAITAWADYVVRRKGEISKLKQTDVGAAMDASNELLRQEGRVAKAYYEYQAATKAAIDLAVVAANAKKAAADKGAPAPDFSAKFAELSSSVAAASAQLVSTVSTFTKK